MNADLERIVGKGQIVVELLGKEAAFRQLAYNYPLKLLSPKCRQQATAIAYMVTYGGGLVGGDSICLDVSVKTGVTLVLLTQVSLPKTKELELLFHTQHRARPKSLKHDKATTTNLRTPTCGVLENLVAHSSKQRYND